MDDKETLKLFDSCWFEMEIFKNRPNSSKPPKPNQNPDEKVQENSSKQHIITSTHRRSTSHDLSSETSFSPDSLSPNTVLSKRKLQTIFSGKEMKRSEEQEDDEEEAKMSTCIEDWFKRKIVENRGRRRRKQKQGTNKSLLDLEFEELKGFMDLGFVFREEDKNTELAEIIPGLQRFSGRKDEDGEEHRKVDDSKILRPYLSEAWEVFDQKRKEHKYQLILNCRIPALSNETNMKDHLRWWAHTVASTVR